MDIKKYAVIAQTVDSASLTGAAEELGLTQSGVSHIIASAEAELGLPLLKRTRTADSVRRQSVCAASCRGSYESEHIQALRRIGCRG